MLGFNPQFQPHAMRLLAVMFLLFLVAMASTAEAKDTRKAVSPSTGSDNILMCSMTGIEINTPSLKGCCTEKSGGGYSCTVCSHAGDNCANYDLDRRSPRQLRELFESGPLRVAPGATAPQTPKGPGTGKTQATTGTVAKE